MSERQEAAHRFVIPAPLASEARERDQAGTQTARCLLDDAGMRDEAALRRCDISVDPWMCRAAHLDQSAS
jgi:hypothetical protein